MKPRIVFHVVAVVVIAAAVAAAQSKNQQKPAQATSTQSRQSSTPSISEREAATGMATGKRQHQPITITAREASSGMATGRVAVPSSNQPSAYESGVVTARETGSGMATGRKSGSVVAADYNYATTSRETGSGMATGKQVSGDPHEYLNERNSAHAVESLDGASKDAAKMSTVQSNPLYKGEGTSGSNPLHKGNDRTAAPSSNNGPKPVEYKDGEDGTTRTRPGNHKPGK
ncbi:MAG: hypothetical protein JST28_05805 [Acidobacteria bacterium]|nr:hypothetical protein [Acidobacteriota bacterium]